MNNLKSKVDQALGTPKVGYYCHMIRVECNNEDALILLEGDCGAELSELMEFNRKLYCI